MMTRQELRASCAQYLNSLDRDTLFKRFEVTRIANITGLDIIRVPVYSAIRPASKTISVSAGKSQDPRLARAGAIAEAIEYHTFENPRDDDHEFWLRPRSLDFPNEWMRSSNGQAIGATFEDAFLQGIYECVERDQVTLRRISLAQLGVHPPKVDLHILPATMGSLIDKIYQASLKLYLMYCTSDIPIPSYWSILADPVGPAFAGWGCHIQHEIAAERSVLEAIQSRCVYIAGARDDILRRDFELTHRRDPKQVIQEMEALPVLPFPLETVARSLSLDDELKVVLSRLGSWRDKIRVKHIDLGDVHAVKVIIDGFEQPQLNDKWREQRWTNLRESFMSARAFTGSNWMQCLENCG